MSRKVPFGRLDVDEREKSELVMDVFDRASVRYDLMNDLMSLGIHRRWRQIMINKLKANPHMALLDVAGGTGDIAHRAIKAGCKRVTVADPSASMMEIGRGRLLDRGIVGEVVWVETAAEDLPFDSYSQDACTIAFGLRNVADIEKALAEMLRVLKPGGKMLCLEFSRPNSAIWKGVFGGYNKIVLPALGKWVLKDKEPYHYLAESIERFHHAEEIASMMIGVGYRRVSYRHLSGGCVALHMGWKV